MDLKNTGKKAGWFPFNPGPGITSVVLTVFTAGLITIFCYFYHYNAVHTWSYEKKFFCVYYCDVDFSGQSFCAGTE